MCAASVAGAVAGVRFGSRDSSQIAPPGAIRCCAEDVGAVVDGVVVLVMGVADVAAVGACSGDSPVPRECRPRSISAGDPGCRIPSNLRILARFFDFPSDIFRDFAVLGSAGKVDLDKECHLIEPRCCRLVVLGCLWGCDGMRRGTEKRGRLNAACCRDHTMSSCLCNQLFIFHQRGDFVVLPLFMGGFEPH